MTYNFLASDSSTLNPPPRSPRTAGFDLPKAKSQPNRNRSRTYLKTSMLPRTHEPGPNCSFRARLEPTRSRGARDAGEVAVTSEPEKKQANRGRGDKNAAVTERAEADAKRADPASVLALTLTTEVASPGESRAGRGRHYGGGGQSAGLSRAAAGGRKHRRRGNLRVGAAGVTASSRRARTASRRAAGGCCSGAASYRWATMGRRAEESRDRG